MMAEAATLLTADERIAITHEMVARYNAQDADAYVALMTDDACQSRYPGQVFRAGKEEVCKGLKATFAQFPLNHADILSSLAVGSAVLLQEKVRHAPDSDPFEVWALYSFDGDKVSRVEFIR